MFNLCGPWNLGFSHSELVTEANLQTAMVWVQNGGSSHKDIIYIVNSPGCFRLQTLTSTPIVSPGQSDLSLSAINISYFSTFLKLQICSFLSFSRSYLISNSSRENRSHQIETTHNPTCAHILSSNQSKASPINYTLNPLSAEILPY